VLGAKQEPGRPKNAKGWADRAIRAQLNRPSLAADRERMLLKVVQGHSDHGARQAALNELWESHSKLVVAIASRYRHSGLDMLDLVGAGHLGLYTAISRFRPDRYESRLSTYATAWITWYIQDYIQRSAGPMRLPSSNAHRQLMQMSGRLFADARRSCQRDQVEPSETELHERIGCRIGMPGDEVARTMGLMRGGTMSLSSNDNGEARTPPLADALADDSASPEDDAILRMDYAKARSRIMILAHEILGERERIVFRARCMTDADVVHLDSLARLLGVSRERICQLEASAKRKIITAMAQEGYGVLQQGSEVLRQSRARARRRAGGESAHRATGLATPISA
jgi:RNA polymerase sigma-32 factor